MDQVLEFFSKLLDSSDWPPRWHCGRWTDFHGWVYIISDLSIWAAYFSIPVVIIRYLSKKQGIKFVRLYFLFAAFILACGATHFLDAVIFWVPVYRLSALTRLVTGVLSWMTVFYLVKLLPTAFSLKTQKEFESEIEQREKAEVQLREAERVKSDFFANVSHELRTPLSLILAPTESLLSGRHGEMSPVQQDLLRTVHNNSVRLLQMVSGILDFSKSEAGKFRAKPQPTNVVQLVRQVLHDFMPMIEEKKISLAVNLKGEDCRVALDPYLFERIVFNLLSNAVKFTPSGGEIGVSLEINDHLLRLSVQDTGIGIAHTDIPLLFQKFRQIESSSTRRFEGTGLGLAMVKEFAELMGGTVAVASEPGKGSVFTVECPVTDVVVSEEEHTLPEHRPMTPKYMASAAVDLSDSMKDDQLLKVLVCEDNEKLGEYIASLLREFCQVQLCSNGREGLQMVRSWSPDLVLTDVMMPVLDGIEMCAEIKSDPRTANTVVVLLTAQTHREAMLKGWEAKADEYLFKPFHPDELITRIRSLLAIVAERKAYIEWMEKKSSELARATAELEQKEQLEMYAKALERTNHQLEEFAIISAHDMKSPISTITGLLMLMEDRKAVKESHTELFEMLKKSAGQTQKTIQALNDAVAFKKTLTIRREDIWFENILQEVRQSLAEPIMASGAVISADFSRCAHICFPPIHMKSIFQNLLSNAIKYAKDGESPFIDISTFVEDSFIVLTVKDQGLGLDLDLYRDRVFRLFQRFHTHKEGMGLGLYLVYSIVEAYGGKIDIQSEVGRGTTFTIYLSNADGE